MNRDRRLLVNHAERVDHIRTSVVNEPWLTLVAGNASDSNHCDYLPIEVIESVDNSRIELGY